MLVAVNKNLLNQYQEMVDISSMVTKTDIDGHIICANNNFCKISGYMEKELLGRTHDIVRHPDADTTIIDEMWNTIKAKKVWQGNIKNRKKDGGDYYVFTTVIPSLDENGEIFEYSFIRHDITELQTLVNNLQNIINKEVEKDHQKNQIIIENLSHFLDGTPNSIIVFKADMVEYANKAFLKMTGLNKTSLIHSKFNFSSLLDQISGFVKNENEFILRKNNKISITIQGKRNIFSLFYEELESVNNEPLKMYTLNNITVNEYQKLKISLYNRQLRDYYRLSKSSSNQVSLETIEKHSEVENKKDIRVLSEQEKTILKSSRNNKAISSKEYSNDIDSYVLEDIQELDEIEEEINEFIEILKQEKNKNTFFEIIKRLNKIATVLHALIEFRDLSFSFSSLANILENEEITSMDETMYKKTLLFLSNIILDFRSWRNIIFIEQSANDIHYLDSSLFSTILQLELLFKSDHTHEDEDDFELF